ncbi:hypothetical protein SARC_10400 [Sphaeroforma arctica JP610]|uniref:Cyclin N-terminal domain-containing protein n=1 Tax=Sphaeroforma arctica JP610 TaxID=667725 RepID=A0A0L0FK36_9EUKA|nr:hypothetical protein SARC_10400 [Sphaeroforma arctica JP610]KNC77134.1 hypothetical protein SARC_10400 [Sphaeroforma arctica JP610]|eukprot:XP_014151036.1 hypothetical protein SARC_10400 [Sphaeroforma arctica JP610]
MMNMECYTPSNLIGLHVESYQLSRFLLQCNDASVNCMYHSVNMSSSTFLIFCEQLAHPRIRGIGPLERATIIHSLHYLLKLNEMRRGFSGHTACASCLMVGCLVIATKYVQEVGGRKNSEWAQLAGLDLAYLNQLEKGILTSLRFDLSLPLARYNDIVDVLNLDPIVSNWSDGEHRKCDGSRFCCGVNGVSRPGTIYQAPFYDSAFALGTVGMPQLTRKISTLYDYNQILQHLRSC